MYWGWCIICWQIESRFINKISNITCCVYVVKGRKSYFCEFVCPRLKVLRRPIRRQGSEMPACAEILERPEELRIRRHDIATPPSLPTIRKRKDYAGLRTCVRVARSHSMIWPRLRFELENLASKHEVVLWKVGCLLHLLSHLEPTYYRCRQGRQAGESSASPKTPYCQISTVHKNNNNVAVIRTNRDTLIKFPLTVPLM